MPSSISTPSTGSLLADIGKLDNGEPRQGVKSIYPILDNRGIRYINYDEWRKIDAAEIERGQPKQKPREKFTYVNEMLAVLE